MKKPKLLFIGKGGAKEGMGHLVRIASMQEIFAPQYEVSVLAKHDSFGDFFFEQKGIAYFTYRDNRGLFRFLEQSGGYRVIVVDIYRISLAVVRRIQAYCRVLVHFDDMKRRINRSLNGFNTTCVFICPQEPFNSTIETRGTITIAKGTDYFPLRRVFKEYRAKKRFNGSVRHIGLILGGVPTGERVVALTRMLDDFLAKHIDIHVVTGYDPAEIDTGCFSSRVRIIKNVDNMAELISGLDLGIIAGGFIKFEFLCIGTPFLMVSLCAHQETLARRYAARGCGVYLGKMGELTANPARFEKKMNAFLANREKRETMFNNARRLVDGDGSSRILAMVNRLNQ
jgi:spore coat polysaccharide biosynthesis predicted glycosyltransferase SpsG